MGICKALMYSGLEWRIYLRSYPQYPEPQWSPKQSDIQHTAFAVAIAMNLPVASMMLLERTNLASTSCMYLGTPLRIAIMHGDTAMVSALIDSGATAYIQNYYVVRNYLQLAVKEDACFEAITLTLAHIKTINPKTSLFQWCLQDIYEKAALQRKTALVTYLLGRWTLEFSVVCHWRVLISYCGYGDFELVQKLVGLVYNDASWVSTKQDGRTPLDKAAERGDLRLCRFLLENLDSIHLHQREEQCWYYAARSGNIEILELLEKYSPEKAALPAYASVLPAAAGAGHLDMAKYAVHRQFDRAKSKKGGKQANPEAIRSFANLFAVINNKRSMVCYLVDELGVDINGEDIHPGHGLTPLRMAIDAGHPEMVQLLLERGAVPPSISALEADFKPGRREPRKSFLGFKSCLPIHHERGKYKLGTVRAVKAAIEVVRCSQEQRFA
ncbi:ankyrin [Polyplosphaeria fusca]|uniref:Ankyrin n=1 Tax=Polyplosphaeria fusca TaxID=682080 RepID=A0A9P4QQ92_9PLEO|nr:ankyrin [Polyplosphaeria fusca]